MTQRFSFACPKSRCSDNLCPESHHYIRRLILSSSLLYYYRAWRLRRDGFTMLAVRVGGCCSRSPALALFCCFTGNARRAHQVPISSVVILWPPLSLHQGRLATSGGPIKAVVEALDAKMENTERVFRIKNEFCLWPRATLRMGSFHSVLHSGLYVHQR